MRKTFAIIFCLAAILACFSHVLASEPVKVTETNPVSVWEGVEQEAGKDNLVAISIDQQFDTLAPGDRSALAIRFKLAKDWHFYADPQSAPAEGMHLKVVPQAKGVTFAEPILPPSNPYYDKGFKRLKRLLKGKKRRSVCKDCYLVWRNK